MDTIYFLIADTVQERMIEQTLWSYQESFNTRHVAIKIEIIDFPRLLDQARAMIRRGARVIITNSGSYQILSNAIDEVPVLCLYSSTNDVLYTLRDIPCRKIHLFLNKHFIFNINACPPDIRQRLIVHPPYGIEPTYHKLLKMVQSLPVTPDTAIVGCTLLPQIARNSPMPIYPIRPSESTILSVYQYALELIAFNKKDRRQLSLLASILSHVTDGIILYSTGGVISHINRQARAFLSLPPDTRNIRDIFPDWQEGSQPSFKEKIIQRPPYILVANSDVFLMDKEKQYILTLRDVTELQRLEKNIRYKLSRTGLTASHHFSDIKTTDPALQTLIRRAATMASYNAPILIQGESGTGKELFAQSIHNASPRRNGPFVAINCAALPPDILESELFGYVGGTFTGARREGKAGLFEMAHNGTIFLDEINSMTPAIQSKLLRVLETKQVMRLGSDYVIPLDIRIISASNADIIQSVRKGTFRRDLFFRINTLRLTLPSLNDRPSDIPYLFSYFLNTISGTSVPVPQALKKILIHHHWWGNIRELYSVALRYHIYGDTGDSSYQYLFDTTEDEQTPQLLDTGSLSLNMKNLETTIEQILIQELSDKGYTQTDIARLLNVSRQTVFNKMKK